MGLCSSPTAGVVDPADAKKSSQLMRQIIADNNGVTQKTKLLLLGAGESGKSTVFKQMSRCVGSTGYTESELKQFRWIIHRNILDAIKTLVEQVHTREIDLVEENEDMADQVLLWDGDNLNPEMAEKIEAARRTQAASRAPDGAHEGWRRKLCLRNLRDAHQVAGREQAVPMALQLLRALG